MSLTVTTFISRMCGISKISLTKYLEGPNIKVFTAVISFNSFSSLYRIHSTTHATGIKHLCATQALCQELGITRGDTNFKTTQIIAIVIRVCFYKAEIRKNKVFPIKHILRLYTEMYTNKRWAWITSDFGKDRNTGTKRGAGKRGGRGRKLVTPLNCSLAAGC